MDALAQASYRGSCACERVRRTGVEEEGGGRRREGASTEKCRGRGEEEEEESKKQTSANLKKWGMTGGEHRTSGLAGGNPQVSSGAESGRKLLSAKNHTLTVCI